MTLARRKKPMHGSAHPYLRARLSLNYLKVYTRRRSKNFRGASKARERRLERNMPHPRARRIRNRIFFQRDLSGIVTAKSTKSTLKPSLVLIAAAAVMWVAAMAIHLGL
jgi:hypothetical protein